MKGVELYGRVRHSVRIEGLSRREAARRFGLDPRTVAKMLVFSVPPGYRRSSYGQKTDPTDAPSRRLTMIVAQKPAQPLAAPHGSLAAAGRVPRKPHQGSA